MIEIRDPWKKRILIYIATTLECFSQSLRAYETSAICTKSKFLHWHWFSQPFFRSKAKFLGTISIISNTGTWKLSGMLKNKGYCWKWSCTGCDAGMIFLKSKCLHKTLNWFYSNLRHWNEQQSKRQNSERYARIIWYHKISPLPLNRVWKSRSNIWALLDFIVQFLIFLYRRGSIIWG